MAQRDYDEILNQWEINDEATRWSLKRQFQLENKNSQSKSNFIVFLEKNFKGRRSIAK